MPLSMALQYIFGIWALLVLAAWGLWRHTREQATKDGEPSAEAD
jgi:hypothetical protein